MIPFVFRILTVLAVLLTLTLFGGDAAASPGDGTPSPGNAPAEFTFDQALRKSQEVLDRPVAPHTLRRSDGRTFSLADLRGRPVLLQLIYTSCANVCSYATRHLADAVQEARQALGEESFTVVTVGFDTANDTPAAMGAFARRHGLRDPAGWIFASGDAETVRQLTDETGFTWFPSPKGFDHLTQVTVLDGEGLVYRQVYGEVFDLPLLVEPLKDLVWGRPRTNETVMEDLVRRVRLFCTTYDPALGRYRFDYSLFIGIAIGLMIIGGGAVFVWRERRRALLSQGPS